VYQKHDTLYILLSVTSPNVNQFRNSFTSEFSSKFATTWWM